MAVRSLNENLLTGLLFRIVQNLELVELDSG